MWVKIYTSYGFHLVAFFIHTYNSKQREKKLIYSKKIEQLYAQKVLLERYGLVKAYNCTIFLNTWTFFPFVFDVCCEWELPPNENRAASFTTSFSFAFLQLNPGIHFLWRWDGLHVRSDRQHNRCGVQNLQRQWLGFLRLDASILQNEEMYVGFSGSTFWSRGSEPGASRAALCQSQLTRHGNHRWAQL